MMLEVGLRFVPLACFFKAEIVSVNGNYTLRGVSGGVSAEHLRRPRTRVREHSRKAQ